MTLDSTDQPHKYNVERKKPVSNEVIQCESINTTNEDRPN